MKKKSRKMKKTNKNWENKNKYKGRQEEVSCKKGEYHTDN
jgi:hypothetical protein